MFKKFLSVITAIYLAASCMLMLVGCGNVDAPNGNPNTPETNSETFYSYDAETEEYDDEDYLTLNGTSVVWCFKDVAINATEFNGNVIFTGDKFTMTLQGSFSVLDTCTVLYQGEREGNGVLRIDSSVITTYSKYVKEPIVVTDSEVMYYCKKGSKPANPILPGNPVVPQPPLPHTITLNANGGKFAGENAITRTTDEDGHISIHATPTRDGYVFKGFNFKADGTGDAVTSATVFEKDTTVYAVWVEEVTVTFMDDNKVFATKKLGRGDMLGDYKSPQASDKYFMGWYKGNVRYLSSTIVTDNITLTAKWRTYKEEEDEFKDYLDGLPSVSLPGHVYIHYLKAEHSALEEGTKNGSAPLYNTAIKSDVYGKWGLWAWPQFGMGRLFNAAWIDVSGAVYDIDTTYTFTDCGWDSNKKGPKNDASKFNVDSIGTQIILISSMQYDGFWTNDGGDNYLEHLLSYNHVFVREGNTRNPVYYNSDTGDYIDRWGDLFKE